MAEAAAIAENPMMDAAIADIEKELAVGLDRARQTWKEAASCIHPDLQPAGYRILSVVIHLNGASGHVLAAALGVDKSVISRQARVLEHCGLIVSRDDDSDRRSRIFEATPFAVDRVSAVRTAQRDRLQGYLRGCSKEEVSGIAALLHILNDSA